MQPPESEVRGGRVGSGVVVGDSPSTLVPSSRGPEWLGKASNRVHDSGRSHGRLCGRSGVHHRAQRASVLLWCKVPLGRWAIREKLRPLTVTASKRCKAAGVFDFAEQTVFYIEGK